MASSQLKTDKRQTLYYNTYKYRATFLIMGSGLTRLTNTIEEFKNAIKKNEEYRQSYWPGFQGQSYRKDNPFPYDYDSIEQYLIWREANKKNIKVRLEYNNIAVFANDLPMLESLQKVVPDVKFSTVEASPSGIMYFVNEPKYKYRVYFRDMRVPDNFASDLTEFVFRYRDTATHVEVSPAMAFWIDKSNRFKTSSYCSSGYFISFNEPSTHSLLSLMFGDALGKYYKLEKRST